MSHLKKTVFWVAALVLIAGGFFFFDKSSEESKVRKEAAQILLPFGPEDVLKLEFIKDNKVIRLVREAETWKVTEPLEALADLETVNGVLTNVVKAKRDAVLFDEPGAGKLKELGLDSPELKIAFTTATTRVVLSFGEKGPTHNITYARIEGDKKVYRVHSDVATESDKSLYELRDKTVVSFDPLQVKSLEIKRRASDTVFIEQPSPTVWDVTSPVKGHANLEHVMETLYKLTEARVKEFVKDFVDGAPKELAAYGLNDPTIVVEVGLGEVGPGNDTGTMIEIGSKDRERRGYYARVNGIGSVMLLEEELVGYLMKKASYWVD